MLRQSKNKKKIAVVRGLDVRSTHAEFACQFKRLSAVFVGNLDTELITYLKKRRLKYFDLSLKAPFLVDPVQIFLGKRTHQSWLHFDDNKLKKALSGIDVFEIYEPYFFYSGQVADIAKETGKFLITEIWTSFPEHPARLVPPYCFNVKRVVKQTDLFILRSQKALNYLEPFKIPDRKKVMVYHGVNLKRFYPKRIKTGDKVKILFVGALGKHKGLDDLLAVFSKLTAEYKNKLELLVCGRGSLKNKVVAMTKALPIKFFGQISHSNIPEIYRQADIFCGPSKEFSTLGIKRWEEFVGYTFMEALATGLPIIATKCGGIPEVVGKNNTLVPQGNRTALFSALKELILDSQKRKIIGKENRERAVKLFDLEKQVKLTEEIILGRLF